MEQETFALTIWALGEHPRIPIDAERVVKLQRANEILILALDFEEALELVISNFEEFEREVFNLSHRWLTRRDIERDTMAADRLLLNRRLANLLSTCRMYMDHGKHHLGHPALPGGLKGAFKESLSRQYDTVLGYRVMEALRNHIQHRNIPTRGIAFPAHREEKAGHGALWSFGVQLNLDLEVLAEDQFKRRVLQDIRNKEPEARDVVFWVREYIEAIGTVHEEVRAWLQDSVVDADRTCAEAINEWRLIADDTTGLSVVSSFPDGTSKNLVYLTHNMVGRRENLTRANRTFKWLSHRYVKGDRAPQAYAREQDPPTAMPL